MNPVWPAFHRLRWKLTLSYAGVTIAALLFWEVVLLLGALLVVVTNAEVTAQTMAQALAREVAPQLSPAFAQAPPDLDRIHGWLHMVRLTGLLTQAQTEVVVNAEASNLQAPTTTLLVLDTTGRLLGRLSQTQPPASPEVLALDTVPALGPAYARALAGTHPPTDLYQRTPEILTIAVPIENPPGMVQGVLVWSAPFGVGVSLGLVSWQLTSSVLLLTLATGIVGTFFGALTARGLTRRLGQMAAVASAWGQGDFSQSIEDASLDEIGQTSRRLNQMAGQLESLLETRAALSILDERNRLARDLHDSVKQQAFAVSMNLGAAQALWEHNPAEARRRVDVAFETARQIQQELTTIIQTLRPAQLEGREMVAAIQDYLDHWRQQSGIEATSEIQGEHELPFPTQEALFRVMQEALANVARHSHATQVHLRLLVQPRQVVLTISDNGCGFDAGQVVRGVGLNSMQERLQRVAGRLQIQSDVDGTIVMAQVPLLQAPAPTTAAETNLSSIGR